MNFSKGGLILRGIAMGIAEVIPGVSGGTIAFITGIYKKLLESITAINLKTLRLIFKGNIVEVFKRVNGAFLVFLFVGMIIGVLGGVFGISYFLENYPEIIWGLFFGLILASVPYMLGHITKKSTSNIFLMLLAASGAYLITCLVPAAGSENYIYIFFGGTLAICALVLPGISGSFILLLLGLYSLIIPTLKTFLQSPNLDSFVILACFGCGCLFGLVFFSRLVSAAFEKHHDPTIAILSGFMLGSLNKIWPWRNPDWILDKSNGKLHQIGHESSASINDFEDYKIVSELNVLPNAYDGNANIILVFTAFLIGILIVFLLYKFKSRLYLDKK